MGYGYRERDGESTIMLEPYEGLEWTGEESQDDFAFAWSDMLETIKASLPPSLRWLDGRDQWQGDRRVIAQGRACEVCIEEDRGGYGYAYVTVKARESFPWILRYDAEDAFRALAVHCVPLVAGALFNRLAEVYEVRRPNGYTSTPYRRWRQAA
ncbi:MAG: hypothetical protein K2Q27_05310 [Novosphingobium sp.]|nr:hypothetical protein [Novosphingobium sp.]